jgi:hypothetical protein
LNVSPPLGWNRTNEYGCPAVDWNLAAVVLSSTAHWTGIPPLDLADQLLDPSALIGGRIVAR